MADAEKVIKGLECCFDVQSEWKDKIWACPTCPYAKDDGEPCETLAPLLNEALTLLKAQEPRVLTLDEVIQWEGAFWLEYIEEDSDYLCCWGYAFFSCASQNAIELIVRDGYRPLYSFIRNEYGARWRCWSARPSDEQRRATPWDVGTMTGGK